MSKTIVPKINPLELKLSKVCFTNNKSMFCIGTDKGFIVCQTSPFNILNHRILKGGGVQIVQMLDMSNLIFLVGDENSKYGQTNIIMYDDSKGKPVAKLQVGHRIKNIKVNSKRLFVLGKNKVFIFKTKDLSNVGMEETIEENESGVCALSENQAYTVFAYPSKTEGFINILTVKGKITDIKNFFGFNERIAFLELNKEGDLLLAASIGGVSIKLFKTNCGDLLEEYKRGGDKAQIFSLSFCPDNKYFCSSSDKGTIHVFNIDEKKIEISKEEEEDETFLDEIFLNKRKISGGNILDKNNGNVLLRQSTTSSGGNIRSWAYVYTNEEEAISIFSEKNAINIVSINDKGKFYKVDLNLEEGKEQKITQVTEILCTENLPYLNP